jgi:hypothetical protein
MWRTKRQNGNVNGGGLTRAAVLLFHRNPEKYETSFHTLRHAARGRHKRLMKKPARGFPLLRRKVY